MAADERFRAAELAAAAGISVQLLRSYQSKGLLPPPRHEGRVAWYGQHHLERLHHIRHLKDRGFSLRMISQALDDEALDRGPPLIDEHEVLRLADVAERSGVPVEILRAMEASRLLRPHHLEDGDVYSEADVRFVRHVLTLLAVGLSLDDLLRIARPQLDASDELGRDVVAAWEELVGRRLRRHNRHAGVPAVQIAASLRAVAAIVGQLVAYAVERAVLDAALADIESRGSEAERAALAKVIAHGQDPG